MLTQPPQIGDEGVTRGQDVGVVVAEDLAPAGEGVLVQLAGPLVLAQPPQVGGEVGVPRGVGWS
jgi:hypothetical protein